MVVLSSSISSRSRRASSCIWLRSCCNLVMYSTVFCSVMAWLVCKGRPGQGGSGRGEPAMSAHPVGPPHPPATHQLGVIRDQAVEGVKAHLDVEAPFLLG